MEPKESYEKNQISLILKGIIITTIIAWFILLIIISINTERYIRFYDVLSQQDVSNNYIHSLPITRYIFEPIIGITFIISQRVDFILFLAILFILAYGVYFIIRRTTDKKIINHPAIMVLKPSLYSSFKIAWIVLLTVIGIEAVLYSVKDFMSVANTFGRALYYATLIISISLVVFIIKNSLHLIKKKCSKLKTKSHTMKNIIFNYFYKVLHHAWVILGIIFLIASFAYSLSSLHLPTQYIETDLEFNEDGEQMEYLFDFHVHTRLSDGFLSPEQRVDWYISQGIHGAAFSDHHHPYGSIAAQKYVEDNNLDFIVFQSQEFTNDPERIHLNIYNIEEAIEPKNYFNVEGEHLMNTEEAIKMTKEQGGYVIVNHYGRGDNIPFPYEQLYEWGVDGFEVANLGNIYPEEIRQFCLENNLIAIGGSDVHGNHELNTFVKLRMPDPSNLTIDAVFEELRKNTHEVVIIENKLNHFSGIPMRIDRFMNYIYSLDTYQLLSWWIWSILSAGLIIYVANRPIVAKKRINN